MSKDIRLGDTIKIPLWTYAQVWQVVVIDWDRYRPLESSVTLQRDDEKRICRLWWLQENVA